MKKIWSFEKQDDGTLAITNYKGTDTEIEIPRTIGKNIVTAIGPNALGWRCNYKTKKVAGVLRKITKVTLPDTIAYIGDNAFFGNENLTEINIPESVIEIGEKAFMGCGFKALTLPESVEGIGKYAFMGYVFNSFTLPKSVKEISRGEFYGCVNLTNMEIPDSVQIIESDAFNSCRGLERIVIPDGVEEIGRDAFAQCWNLRTVVIPASVKEIGVDDTGSSPLTIFLGSKNVTAIVEPKSYAEEYCSKYQIPYRYSEDE